MVMGGKRGVLWLCGVVACGPAVEGGDGSAEGGSSTSSSGGTTVMSDSASMTSTAGTSVGTSATTVDPGSSSDDGSCGAYKCEPCAPGCEANEYCEDGEFFCECVCPDVCSPDPAQEFAQMSKTEPLDCGTAAITDPVETWQAVHDCVVAQSGAQSAFWADWGGSSDPYGFAVAGAVGFQYALGYWESSGFGTVTQYGCEAIADLDGCVVAPEQMCLTCVGQTDGEILCDPK